MSIGSATTTNIAQIEKNDPFAPPPRATVYGDLTQLFSKKP